MLDEAISRALERHPEQRFQSAAELRQALEAALREPERIRRRRRRMGFAVMGAMTIALGGLGYTGYQKPDVRARAMAMVEPLLHKVEQLRHARAAARNAPVAVASVKPSAPSSAGSAAPADNPGIDVLAAAGQPAQVEPIEAGDDRNQQSGAGALARRIAQSVRLMEAGNRLKGYNQLRDLGRQHMTEPSALEAWGRAAVEMRAWGEALHVARLWSKVDPGVDSGLNLARMQRRAGRRDEAVRTLAGLVKNYPACDKARSMLGVLGGAELVAQN